jgi:hypothetical protein
MRIESVRPNQSPTCGEERCEREQANVDWDYDRRSETAVHAYLTNLHVAATSRSRQVGLHVVGGGLLKKSNQFRVPKAAGTSGKPHGYECERSVATHIVLLPCMRNNAAGGTTDVRRDAAVRVLSDAHRRRCFWKQREGQPNAIQHGCSYGREGFHVGVIGAALSVSVGGGGENLEGLRSFGEIGHLWLRLRSGHSLGLRRGRGSR